MYVVKQNQSNSGFTFDTQLKTALKYFVLITAEFYKLNCEVPIRLDITPGGLFKSTTNKTTTAFCMVSQKKVSALCAHTWFMMLRTHPVGVLSVYRSIFCRNLSVELALAFFKISKDHPKACQFTAAIERVEQTGTNYQDRTDDREDRGRSARRRRDSSGFWHRYISVFLLGWVTG